jgi:hypothetical protein
MAALLLGLPAILWTAPAPAQEQLPWQRNDPRSQPPDDAYRPAPRYDDQRAVRPYEPPPPPRYDAQNQPQDGAYRPPRNTGELYNDQRGNAPRGGDYAQRPGEQRPGGEYRPSQGRYGEPYTAYDEPPPGDRRYDPRPYNDGPPGDGYSSQEILSTGHSFFGSVSKGMASVVEYAFQKQGRPNGYILGQDAGAALVAGLRYGEGTLHTRDAGTHRVYWQGPSIGYDAGVEGSKVMILVYNLRDPEEIYQRFGGVDGSAYIVGGVGVTFQKSGDVVAAPIRAGVGLRLGANVGYLKYTRKPTWNPF